MQLQSKALYVNFLPPLFAAINKKYSNPFSKYEVENAIFLHCI